MKKFYLAIMLTIVGANMDFAQKVDNLNNTKSEINISSPDPLTKKGQMFVFWGWNRTCFSKSDIHFKGADYNFALSNVVAHDRPSDLSWDYINPGEVSIPQFNFRLGYFIKDNLAVVLAHDHMKYVMDQNQTVDFSGYIANPTYATMINNGTIDLSDSKFLQYEHTDGLNYINLGLEKYKNILNHKKFDIAWAYGGGLGVLFPRSNVTLMQYPRSDRFHIAGFGLDARTSLNLIFWNHWMARVEGKYGYINMPDVKTTLNNQPNKAWQDFTFYQINFGVGYTFNTKKSK